MAPWNAACLLGGVAAVHCLSLLKRAGLRLWLVLFDWLHPMEFEEASQLCRTAISILEQSMGEDNVNVSNLLKDMLWGVAPQMLLSPWAC
eukprot:jgi/Astpho2/6866/Aster-06538